MAGFWDFFNPVPLNTDSKTLWGSKDKLKQYNRFGPGQENVWNMFLQGLQGGGGPFGGMFGEFDPMMATNTFEKGVAQPAMRNFEQRIIPQIMQSFADQGASSGLNQTLSTSGRDLQENLGSMLANFIYQSQLQHNQNRMQGLGLAFGTQQYQPYIQQGYPGIVPGMLQGFAQGAGQAAGAGFF